MKKTTLFLALCLVAAFAFGQHTHRPQHDNPFRPTQMNEPNRAIEQRMIAYYASDNYEFCYYTYNDQNQVVDIYHILTGSYEVHDSIRYNTDGQLVRIDGYQLMNANWQHVYYLEYTYNDQGLLASRANYNYASDWELGGLYQYYYNPEGQIVQSDLIFGGELFTSVEYSYVDGLLVEELWSMADFGSTTLSPSQKTEYAYTDGKPTESNTFYYDNGDWVADFSEEYQYDANGNCTLHQVLTSGNMVSEKSIYLFNNQLLANTLIPSTPESERPYTYTNVNNYVVEQWYSLDDNNVLQYVCDYQYDYDDNVSIGESEKQHSTVFPNPCQSQLNIQNNYTGAIVEVYDIFGKLVLTGNLSETNSTINLSACKSGVYFVKIMMDGTTVETVKVVKR